MLNCLELAVEIRAPDTTPEMLVFAIPSYHPLVASWPHIRSAILNVLENYEWTAINVLLYGENQRKARPTVFITLKQIPEISKGVLQQQVETACAAAQVDVVVREGKIEQTWQDINEDTPTGSLPHQTYQRSVDGGWSIGVDESSSETMGGYIRLRNRITDETEVYALTNYHVIRPSADAAFGAAFSAAFDGGTAESE